MAFTSSTTQAAPVTTWEDPNFPGVIGSIVDGYALVEFPSTGGMKNFVRMPLSQVSAVVAALQAIQAG